MGHKSIILVAVLLLGGLTAVAQSTAKNQVKLNLLGGATVTLSDAPGARWENASKSANGDRIVRDADGKGDFDVIMEADDDCEDAIQDLAKNEHVTLNNVPARLLPSAWKGNTVLVTHRNLRNDKPTDNRVYLCFAGKAKSIKVTARYDGNIADADAAIMGDTLTRLAALFPKFPKDTSARKLQLAVTGLVLTIPAGPHAADWKTVPFNKGSDAVYLDGGGGTDGFAIGPVENSRNCSLGVRDLAERFEKIDTPEWVQKSLSAAWYRDSGGRHYGCIEGSPQSFFVILTGKSEEVKPILNALFDAVKANTKAVSTANNVVLTQLGKVVQLNEAGGARWRTLSVGGQDNLVRILPGKPNLSLTIEPARFGKTCDEHMSRTARMYSLQLNNVPPALFPFTCTASVKANITNKAVSDIYTCFEQDNKLLAVEISYEGNLNDPDASVIPDTLKRIFPVVKCADPGNLKGETLVLSVTGMRVILPGGNAGEGWRATNDSGQDALTRTAQGKRQKISIADEGPGDLGCRMMAKLRKDSDKVAKPDFAPDSYGGVWYREEGDVSSCVTGKKNSYTIRVTGGGADMKPVIGALLEAMAQ